MWIKPAAGGWAKANRGPGDCVRAEELLARATASLPRSSWPGRRRVCRST